MHDRLAVLPQYFLPKQKLSELAGRIAGWKGGGVTTALIERFVRRYQVDMSEAANPDLRSYATFNDFFTRPLREGARPLAASTWISPVDGAISQLGSMARDQIFQAKGHHYSSADLLGGDAATARLFDQGAFATLYLSPRDYHRIHMPCDGRLTRMTHVPGDLFSVNPTTARGVAGLFARNERVVCLFDTAHGPLALVLVGATVVGSMATVWHGVVNPPRPATARTWHYGHDHAQPSVALSQGEEMGRFLLGSTVVMLFPAQTLQFNPAWVPGKSIRLGEAMAQALPRN